MLFYSRLRQLREQHRLSQKDLAAFLGVTRQAIASYELGKREPGFNTLIKLADYFNVSADYLLGRVNCNDPNAYIIGRNLRLIRGDLTYKQICEKISMKMGVLIFPEMFEMYEKGQYIPCTGTIKMLSKYANVRESFFYTNNTAESLERERKLYRTELERNLENADDEEFTHITDVGKKDLLEWLKDEENLMYARMARELKEYGITFEEFKIVVQTLRRHKISNQ